MRQSGPDLVGAAASAAGTAARAWPPSHGAGPPAASWTAPYSPAGSPESDAPVKAWIIG